MKSVLVILSFVFASTSFAAMPKFATASVGPAVGDQATYAVNTNQGGMVMSLTVVEEITAVDTSSQMVTMQQTTYYNGAAVQSQSNQSSISEVSYPTDAEISSQCALASGNGTTAVLESVTVRAGTFTACHVKTSDPASGSYDMYIGSVPFGLLKNTMADLSGSTMTMELVSFKKN